MASEDSTKGIVSDGWSTDYYTLPVGASELQDLIEYKNMNFAVANIFKAAYRLGDKAGTSKEYDLNKIIFFAQRELFRMKKYVP
jgi:hypothetical protein